jgi:acylphosphatase
MKTRALILITGKVQGVFFRDFTRENAIRLGLTGWVRNAPAGGVELVVEGEKEKILQLVEKLHQGPPVARVKEISVNWQAHEGEFDNFSITW